MPRVYNWRQGEPPEDAVWVMAGSPWSNPWPVTPGVRNRRQALAEFRPYAEDRHRRDPSWLAELRGADLVCCCKPKDCHADVLLELANS